MSILARRSPAPPSGALRRPLRRALALALAAGVACAHAGAEARMQVALKAQASVAGDRVRLADLVDVLRDDDGLAARLIALDLGPAPAIDRPVRLELAEIRNWVRGRRPVLDADVDWVGADVVSLSREAQVLESTRVEELGRDTLERWLATRSDSHELAVVAPIPPLRLPLGRVALAARPLPQAGRAAPRMQVWIDVSVDGRVARSVPASFDVKAFRRAWTAAVDLAPGTTLDPALVTAATVDVAAAGDAPWSAPTQDMRVRRRVPAGRVLTALDVETRPPVVRGDDVVVFSRAGELSIEAHARALQDGRPGQDVMVRIDSSRSPVQARVLKPGLVEIVQ